MWRRPAEAASPLVVAVQGVRQYDSTSCVDGPRGASGRPRESATLTTDSTANHRPSKPAGGGDAVASAADRRRQRQLSVDPSVILSSRPSVQPLRHRTQAAETAAEDALAEVLNLYERNEGLSAGRYHEYELDVPSKRHVLKSSRTSSSRQPTITICFSRISPTIERSFLRGYR